MWLGMCVSCSTLGYVCILLRTRRMNAPCPIPCVVWMGTPTALPATHRGSAWLWTTLVHVCLRVTVLSVTHYPVSSAPPSLLQERAALSAVSKSLAPHSTCTCTHTHAYTHTNTHAHTHHTHAHTHMHAHTQIHMHTHTTHTCTHTHAHTHTQTRTHTYTQTCTHTRTQTHTHAHCILAFKAKILFCRWSSHNGCGLISTPK